MEPTDILIKYWGHTNFRSKQKEVILSILNNQDTLALLPVGIGKSVCFQIPALIKDGLCLVISPLVSLMRDQTKHLSSKGIKSVFISSAISRNQLDLDLTNCLYGNVKFLYLSPEILNNQLVIKYIEKININLIAIDEAHCISDWGSSFRPSYRNIIKIKELIPNASILALTATATNEVVKDIQDNLNIKNQNVIKGSFKKDNISHVVIKSNNKIESLLKLLKKIKSSVIVYVNTRKTCKLITEYLNKNNLPSEAYHGGIDQKIRELIQDKWTNNLTRIMVATHAFGMGINKTDIRLIIHYDIPFSIENYIQQSGRSGRDGKLAYSFTLFKKLDIDNNRQIIQERYPKLHDVKKIYQKIMDFLQIPENTNSNLSIPFNIIEFSKKYSISILKIYNVCKILENEDIIKLSQSNKTLSRIKIIISRSELYSFQISNKKYDNILNFLLRNFSGIFTDFTNIKESEISKKLYCSIEEVKKFLNQLHNQKLIHYIPKNKFPQINLLGRRIDSENIYISEENIQIKKDTDLAKFQKLTNYLENNTDCRRNILLEHFNESNTENCNICDNCVQKNNKRISNKVYESTKQIIIQLLLENELSFEEIKQNVNIVEEKDLKQIIRRMFDADIIEKLGNKLRYVKN